MTAELDREIAEHLVGFVQASSLYDVRTGERLPYEVPQGDK